MLKGIAGAKAAQKADGISEESKRLFKELQSELEAIYKDYQKEGEKLYK